MLIFGATTYNPNESIFSSLDKFLKEGGFKKKDRILKIKDWLQDKKDIPEITIEFKSRKI